MSLSRITALSSRYHKRYRIVAQASNIGDPGVFSLAILMISFWRVAKVGRCILMSKLLSGKFLNAKQLFEDHRDLRCDDDDDNATTNNHQQPPTTTINHHHQPPPLYNNTILSSHHSSSIKKISFTSFPRPLPGIFTRLKIIKVPCSFRRE